MYQLSEEELNERFARDILAGLLAGYPEPQPKPRLVVVAGQPGAGKSHGERALVGDLGLTSAVAIDADDLRPFHPAYRGLAQADDRTADALTQAAAGAWVGRAMRHAIAHRFNIIWSSPLGNPDTAQWMHRLFHGTGYAVDVAFVGVDAARSKLAILHRYQRGRDTAGTGRIVSFDYHDRQYTGLLATAERIEADRLAAGVHVYNRNGQVLYVNRFAEARWSRPPSAAQALAAERARPWTPQELAGFRSIAGWLGRASDASPPQPHLLPEHECSPLAADLRPQLAEAVTAGLVHLRRSTVSAAAAQAAYRTSVRNARRATAIHPPQSGTRRVDERGHDAAER